MRCGADPPLFVVAALRDRAKPEQAAQVSRRQRTAGVRSTFAQALPVVGTTWRDRGPAYWWRRLVMSLGLLAILALYGGIVAGVAVGIGSRTGVSVFLAITAACAVLSAVWYLRRQRLARIDLARAGRKGLRETRWYFTVVRAGQVIAVLLAVAAVVADALHHTGFVRLAGGIVALIVGVVFVGTVWATGGALLVAFVLSLGRELPVERQARQVAAATTRLGSG
jgi:hypothetical protein